MAEIIPLPSEQLERKAPARFEIQPVSFPERMIVDIQWNFIAEKYQISITHIDIDEKVIENLAQPYLPMEYTPYIIFVFLDVNGEVDAVTPSNIGNEVKLYAFPGPRGNQEVLP